MNGESMTGSIFVVVVFVCVSVCVLGWFVWFIFWGGRPVLLQG